MSDQLLQRIEKGSEIKGKKNTHILKFGKCVFFLHKNYKKPPKNDNYDLKRYVFAIMKEKKKGWLTTWKNDYSI